MKHPTDISSSFKDFDILDMRFWSAFVVDFPAFGMHIDIYEEALRLGPRLFYFC